MVRDSRGRFAPGTCGKRNGWRNKATVAVMSLMRGEAEALTRAAINAALAGDPAALRLCIERLAPPPKDSPVTFTLPSMKTATDAAGAAAAVLEACASGELTPTEATRVMALVDSFRRTLELTEIEARLSALEAAE